jgi:hypothetical protein
MTVSLTRGGLPSAVVARLVPAAPIVWRIALVLVVARTSPATRAHVRRFKTTEKRCNPRYGSSYWYSWEESNLRLTVIGRSLCH